jgi:DNA replication and repair protein RecF
VLVDDSNSKYTVRLECGGEPGEKRFTINGTQPDKLSSVIGMFPVVILSPEKSTITSGAPVDRRKFVDLVLSQLSRSYFDDLLEYRQSLRQRNKILLDAKQEGRVRHDVLEPWSLSLATYGARIVQKRVRFVEEFRQYVTQAYAEIVKANEEPAVYYSTPLDIEPNKSLDQLTEVILGELKKKMPEEYRRGLSLVGPHRDDLVFQLNGIDLQKYASQGQHKTFLMALKLAEFHYLKEKKNESPILLLDDIFSDLDSDRSMRLLGHIAELGQALITTTDESLLGEATRWGVKHRKYHVEQGTCKPIGIGSGEEAAVGASCSTE